MLRRRLDRSRGSRRAAAMLVLAGSVAILAVTHAGSTEPSNPAARGGAECTDLQRQYDVAAPAHRGAPHAAQAQRERDTGVAQCQSGNYGDGIAALRRALHDIGVKPVRLAINGQP